MSNDALNLVWGHSCAEGTHRLVLLALADRMGVDLECWPGKRDIARRCRISARSVQRSIKALRNLGEISVDEGGGMKANGGQTNRYRLMITPETTCLPEKNSAHPGHNVVSPLPDTVVSSLGDDGVSQTLSRNPQRKPLQPPAASRPVPSARRGGGGFRSLQKDSAPCASPPRFRSPPSS
jgi:hypothetical protein